MMAFYLIWILLFDMDIIKSATANNVYNYPNPLCCHDHFCNPIVYGQPLYHSYNSVPFPWFQTAHRIRHHHFSPNYGKHFRCNPCPMCQPLNTDLYSVCMDHCVKISYIFQNECDKKCDGDKEKFTTEILSTETEPTIIPTTYPSMETETVITTTTNPLTKTETTITATINPSTKTKTAITTTTNLHTTAFETSMPTSEENDIEHVTLSALKQSTLNKTNPN